jgi:hypothetical protein
MGNAVGLRTVLMTGVESTYGTPVVVDRAFEIDSESLDRTNEIIPSDALRSGSRNLRTSSRRVVTSRMGGGDVVMQVPTNGFGRWLQMALGGTSSIVQVGATPAYMQTHSMGTLAGKSQTIQKQIRDQANTTVGTFTHHGAKVTTMQLAVSKKGILIATFGIDSEDVDTSTAAATPSYTVTRVFHFGQATSLTLGGTVTGGLVSGGTALASVTDFTVTLDNHLNTDEFFLGGGGLKAEPLEDAYPEVTGSITARFASPTAMYDAFAADTGLALQLSFSGAVISGAETEQLIISVPKVHLTGEAPKANGPGVIAVTVPFEGQFDGTNGGMYCFLKSTDTSI